MVSCEKNWLTMAQGSIICGVCGKDVLIIKIQISYKVNPESFFENLVMST